MRVVVAGADVGVAADALGLVAHDHRQLAVGLQPDQPVDDVAARLLQLAGPADVGLLVEPGLDLDDHQHLLAGLGGIDQGVDDRGVAGGAVQRLLDREHVRIGRRLLEEPLDRCRERVVRVVQEYVVPAGGFEDVDRLGRLDLGQLSVGRRHERVVLEVLARQVGDRVESDEVQQPVDPEDLVLGDAELLDEQLEHLRGDRLLDLETHRGAEAPAQQLLLEGLEEVLCVVLLDLEVLVAGDPEGVDLEHLHAGEEALEVLADDVLERHEPLVAERDEAAEDRRHLHPGEVLLAVLGVAHEHGEVQREAGDVGERVGRVDGKGRQHREDAVLEQPLARLLLVAVEVGPADELDALRVEQGDELLAEEPGVALHLVARLGPDAFEDVARHQSGGRPDGDIGSDPALEAGDADHEELVEVAGEDRGEAHPLEQRETGVLGLAEHAAAVGEPGELTVEEAVVVRRHRGQRVVVRGVRRLDVERLVRGDVRVA